jgi:anaerobic ribonucleoside-triphosphate reductase activating protein
MNELLEKMSKPYIDGITLSGGDPFYVGNREKIAEICKTLKEHFPNKTIWCYTGYVYDQVKDLEAMKYIDVLVDGPFIIEKKNLMLLFRGSENQRLIDMNKTRECSEIVLYEKE